MDDNMSTMMNMADMMEKVPLPPNVAEMCQDRGIDTESSISQAMFAKFEQYDADGNGYIDSEEMIHVLQDCNQNPSMEEAERYVMLADKDGDGKVSFAEFIRLTQEHLKTPEQLEKDLKDAFMTFDTEGKGYLNKEELRDVLCSMGERMTEEEADDMFELIDTDQDGEINYEEFVAKFSGQEQMRKMMSGMGEESDEY